MIRKIDVKDANNYEFLMPEQCIIIGCNNPCCWHIDNFIFMCDEHFKELPNYKEVKEK